MVLSKKLHRNGVKNGRRERAVRSGKSVPLVSVVIPVYKTEKYLEECIASVLGQDYPKIELILVDDAY